MKLFTLLSLALLGIILITSCGSGGSSTGGSAKADSPTNRANPFFGGGYTGTEVFIPSDSANKMISSYLQSVDSSTGVDSALHSLIFDADSLRAYLSNPAIKRVKVMFGHTLEYINAMGPGHNVGYESGALTVIFGGINAEGNYIFWQENRVPNHGAPCPYNCVSSGTAANDLFPIIH